MNNTLVPSYLAEKRALILQLGPQQLGPWISDYDSLNNNAYPLVQRVYSRFPNKTLNRSDLIDLWRGNDLGLACVATMMWGLIDSKKGHLQFLLRMGDQVIEERLKAICNSIRRGAISTAFRRAENSHKLDGVAHAFHTKILHFFALSLPLNERPILTPLIFDKWTKNAFFALLTQIEPDTVSVYFSPQPWDKVKKDGVLIRTGEKRVNAYMAYLEYMNYWAEQLGVPPEQLEQFVFGHSRKGNKAPDNPRVELLKIIEDYCVT